MFLVNCFTKIRTFDEYYANEIEKFREKTENETKNLEVGENWGFIGGRTLCVGRISFLLFFRADFILYIIMCN